MIHSLPAPRFSAAHRKLRLLRGPTIAMTEKLVSVIMPASNIDVEGRELDVLLGAKKLLLATEPLSTAEGHPGLLASRGAAGRAKAEYREASGSAFCGTNLKRATKGFFNRQNNSRDIPMRCGRAFGAVRSLLAPLPSTAFACFRLAAASKDNAIGIVQ